MRRSLLASASTHRGWPLRLVSPQVAGVNHHSFSHQHRHCLLQIAVLCGTLALVVGGVHSLNASTDESNSGDDATSSSLRHEIDRFENDEEKMERMQQQEEQEALSVPLAPTQSILSPFLQYPAYCEDVRNSNARPAESNDISDKLGQMLVRTSLQERPLRFIHIPKTGGKMKGRFSGFRGPKHLTASSSARNAKQETDLSPQNFRFTVIRNPWDRVASWFRFCLHGWENGQGELLLPEPHTLCTVARENKLDFNAFVREVLTPGCDLRGNVQTMCQSIDRPDCEELQKTLLRENFYMTQYEWITIPDGGGEKARHTSGFLTDFTYRKVVVDFIFRFENFEDNFRTLSLLIGRPCAQLGHKNGSQLDDERMDVDPNLHAGDWRALYDTHSRGLVRRHFQVDVDVFGYTFEGN